MPLRFSSLSTLSALRRTASRRAGARVRLVSTAAKQAESDVHSHYAEELERLETDMSKRIDLSKRAFPAWAKKFNYTLQSADEGSGRMMIVATKREPTINADVTLRIDPLLYQESMRSKGGEEEEEEEDGLGTIRFTAEVKKVKGAGVLALRGALQAGTVYVGEVAVLDANGAVRSAYDVQRLDEEGFEKFQLYLGFLGLTHPHFITAAYAAAYVQQAEEHSKCARELLSFTKQ